MPRVPDLPCAGCGALMWRGTTSLPEGLAMCRPCRAALPTSRANTRKPPPERACEECTVPFTGQRGQRYCSRPCSQKAVQRERAAPQHAVLCTWCEREYVTGQTRPMYCSTRCKSADQGQRRRALERRSEGTHSRADVCRLWLMFGERCAYCLTRTEFAKIEADHVQAISRDGRNSIDNLLPACKPCNASKRALTLSEWDSFRASKGLEPRHTAWTKDDVRYSHLIFVV